MSAVGLCVRMYMFFLLLFFFAYLSVFPQAETYDRAGDSTQAFWTGLSWRSLGSDWSSFARGTLRARLALRMDKQD